VVSPQQVVELVHGGQPKHDQQHPLTRAPGFLGDPTV
jgi:hypothetical protein